MTGPDPSLDFISLYGLGPVATSVARNDPYTGEKINRLRKSYKGKIKEYGLSGRNDAVKHEPGAPGRLLDLSAWPEDEWFNQKVYGKEMKVADPGSDLERIQLKAMRSAPGILPDNDVWEDALGHEKPVKSADALKFSAAPRQVSNASVSSAAPSPTTTDYASTRPKRTGKKRSYHDSSFIGYGEGFADDDGNSVQSTDESGKTGKKKRRKVRLLHVLAAKPVGHASSNKATGSRTSSFSILSYRGKSRRFIRRWNVQLRSAMTCNKRL